jgi:hypothetical protein
MIGLTQNLRGRAGLVLATAIILLMNSTGPTTVKPVVRRSVITAARSIRPGVAFRPSPPPAVAPTSHPPTTPTRSPGSPVVPLAAAFRPGSLSAWSATLQLVAPQAANRAEIRRNGRLLDVIATTPGATISYLDQLLWPRTTYIYDARWLAAGGSLLSDQGLGVRTSEANGPFPRPYSASSFWNQAIGSSSATDPNSAAMVTHSLAADAASANLANSDAWGIAVAYANRETAVYPVACRLYGCDTPVSFPIPRYAAPTTGSDHHLTVIDSSSGAELDTWEASYDPASSSWAAGSRYLTSSTGWGAVCGPGRRCGGAVAAGFAALGGIIRPEEIAQGHIDHALFLTIPHVRRDAVACPATGSDGDDPSLAALPEGAHVQLDPRLSVDAQPWPRWEKVIAHALQQYGAYVGDTGDTLAVRAEATLDRGYDAWAFAGVPSSPSLATIPWAAFRVLTIQPC